MEGTGSKLIGALLEQRYRVDALLAHGGMSSVYRGLDTRLDRPVAIKVMDPRFAADPAFVERFEREARSAAKIHHPNVVAVHDQGLDGEHVYLVMELVRGGTLRDLLHERGALPAPLVVSIMEPVLSALAAAHRAGLIHRDIKPENVLIGAGGVVKVADFGLVRAIHSPGTTKSSVILGTVSYLSPEQVTTGAATARGDVYSAGIVLYESLTGTAPYRGENALSVAYRHVNDDVPPPSASVAGVPPLLDELVVRSTRRDAGARPADGAGFLVDLQHVRTALNLPRMRVPVPTPVPEETMPVDDSTAAGGSGRRRHDEGNASGVLPIGPEEPPGQQEAATIGARPATGENPVLDDPESTVRVRPVESPLSAAQTMTAAQSATVVHQVPPGFSAAGPRGTRAMLRSDVERATEQARQQQYLQQAQQHPYSGPQPLPYAGGGHPPTGPQQAPRRGGRPRWLFPTIAALVVVAMVATGIWWFSAGRYTDVPTLVGQPSATAEQAVRDADLSPRVTQVRDNSVPAGVVIETRPGSGAEVLRGGEVELIVSQGRPVVPDVSAGASPDEAEQALRDAELQPQRDDGMNAYDEKIPEGQVLKLNPPSGTPVDIGQRVVVVLSKGPAPKRVPDVRGKTRDEAFAALSQAGFEPYDGQQEFVADVEGGRAVRTDPVANTEVPASGSKRVAVVTSNAVVVPDLNGKTIPEAQAQVAGLGLGVQLTGGFAVTGGARIYKQDPAAGTRVAKGTTVNVEAFG
ncbi:protein kinase domain-containing protein [Actinokineospora sp. G85]|uniref:Stk1 family PASTA domain-containing Ser/Thr kinase n=1 Tax=Actinokineospora sp. G85 TaxID=3406626 RepID=UPI003C74216D